MRASAHRHKRLAEIMSLDDIETASFSDGRLPRDSKELRIVSWNIARGAQLKEVIEFLHSADADIICLQETDRNARRTGRRNIAEEIARALCVNYVFGAEFDELSEGTRDSPAHHGQVTLSRFPLETPRILRFRAQSAFWRPRWWIPNVATFQRRDGGRLALVSKVRMGDRSLSVYNLHLESRSDHVRRLQLGEMFEDARQNFDDHPVVVGGDFNLDLTRSSAASLVSAAFFVNPFDSLHIPTTPANHPGRDAAIDWVLFRGRVRPIAARVHDSVGGSDHYPLSVTLRLLESSRSQE